MLNRLQARIRFTKASGLATWAYNQMAVRHGQAIHINEGLANEEPAVNEVTEDGADHEVYTCDLPLMDEAHADDAYNTLTAGSVFHPDYVSGFDDGEGGVTPSYVERHDCYHDETPTKPCAVVAVKRIPE